MCSQKAILFNVSKKTTTTNSYVLCQDFEEMGSDNQSAEGTHQVLL